MSSTIRTSRLAADIHKVLAEVFHHQVRDPRLQNITLHEVRVSRDLSYAKIYLSQMGTKAEDSAPLIKLLNNKKGFYRKQLAQALKLRIVPDIRFFYDDTLDNADAIESLIAKALNKK